MKKYLLVLLTILSSLAYSQETSVALDKATSGSWGYTVMKSDFNGKFQLSFTIGQGQFPYNNPMLVVRYKNGEYDIMVSEVNNSLSQSKSIKFCFDSGEVNEYSTSSFSGGEIWVVNESKDVIHKIIEKLKNSSKVSIRLDNGYKTYDYSFKLNGSTAMINKIKEGD